MKKIIVLMMICASMMLLWSCSKSVEFSGDSGRSEMNPISSELPTETEKDESPSQPEEPALSMEERAALVQEGMTYAEVRAIMGSRGVDVASGVINYVWVLSENQYLDVDMRTLYGEETPETVYPDDCIITGVEVKEIDDSFWSSYARCLLYQVDTYLEVRHAMRRDGTYVGKENGYDVYEWDLPDDQYLKVSVSQPSPEPSDVVYPDDYVIENVSVQKR